MLSLDHPIEPSEIFTECIFSGESMSYVNAEGQPSSEADDFCLTRPLCHATFSSGYLLIHPLKEKPRHRLVRDNVVGIILLWWCCISNAIIKCF